MEAWGAGEAGRWKHTKQGSESNGTSCWFQTLNLNGKRRKNVAFRSRIVQLSRSCSETGGLEGAELAERNASREPAPAVLPRALEL